MFLSWLSSSSRVETLLSFSFRLEIKQGLGVKSYSDAFCNSHVIQMPHHVFACSSSTFRSCNDTSKRLSNHSPTIFTYFLLMAAELYNLQMCCLRYVFNTRFIISNTQGQPLAYRHRMWSFTSELWVCSVFWLASTSCSRSTCACFSWLCRLSTWPARSFSSASTPATRAWASDMTRDHALFLMYINWFGITSNA